MVSLGHVFAHEKKEINGFLMQRLEELITFSGDSKSYFLLCSIFMKKITFNWLSREHLGWLAIGLIFG